MEAAADRGGTSSRGEEGVEVAANSDRLSQSCASAFKGLPATATAGSGSGLILLGSGALFQK